MESNPLQDSVEPLEIPTSSSFVQRKSSPRRIAYKTTVPMPNKISPDKASENSAALWDSPIFSTKKILTNDNSPSFSKHSSDLLRNDQEKRISSDENDRIHVDLKNKKKIKTKTRIKRKNDGKSSPRSGDSGDDAKFERKRSSGSSPSRVSRFKTEHDSSNDHMEQDTTPTPRQDGVEDPQKFNFENSNAQNSPGKVITSSQKLKPSNLTSSQKYLHQSPAKSEDSTPKKGVKRKHKHDNDILKEDSLIGDDPEKSIDEFDNKIANSDQQSPFLSENLKNSGRILVSDSKKPEISKDPIPIIESPIEKPKKTIFDAMQLEIFPISHILFGAFIGSIVRYYTVSFASFGVKKLGVSSAASAIFFKTIFANSLGCFVIGFAAVFFTKIRKTLFDNFNTHVKQTLRFLPHTKKESDQKKKEEKKELSRYISPGNFMDYTNLGITTGFCGCLTTFSAWQLSITTTIAEPFWNAIHPNSKMNLNFGILGNITNFFVFWFQYILEAIFGIKFYFEETSGTQFNFFTEKTAQASFGIWTKVLFEQFFGFGIFIFWFFVGKEFANILGRIFALLFAFWLNLLINPVISKVFTAIVNTFRLWKFMNKKCFNIFSRKKAKESQNSARVVPLDQENGKNNVQEIKQEDGLEMLDDFEGFQEYLQLINKFFGFWFFAITYLMAILDIIFWMICTIFFLLGMREQNAAFIDERNGSFSSYFSLLNYPNYFEFLIIQAFAPLGVLLRYYLSKNNKKLQAFLNSASKTDPKRKKFKFISLKCWKISFIKRICKCCCLNCADIIGFFFNENAVTTPQDSSNSVLSLTKYPNAKFAYLPAFTFICNVLGTFLAAVAYFLMFLTNLVLYGSNTPQSTSSLKMGVVNGSVLSWASFFHFFGLGMLGFCACLTTISTFVKEITELETSGQKLFYWLSTVVVSQFFVCLILFVPYAFWPTW